MQNEHMYSANSTKIMIDIHLYVYKEMCYEGREWRKLKKCCRSFEDEQSYV